MRPTVFFYFSFKNFTFGLVKAEQKLAFLKEISIKKILQDKNFVSYQPTIPTLN